MEMSYIKQGEEAIQKSLNILGEKSGWKTEAVMVRLTVFQEESIYYNDSDKIQAAMEWKWLKSSKKCLVVAL